MYVKSMPLNIQNFPGICFASHTLSLYQAPPIAIHSPHIHSEVRKPGSAKVHTLDASTRMLSSVGNISDGRCQLKG